MADWQEEKRRVLEEAHCIVFKVGSAVITDDQGLSCLLYTSPIPRD